MGDEKKEMRELLRRELQREITNRVNMGFSHEVAKEDAIINMCGEYADAIECIFGVCAEDILKELAGDSHGDQT